MEARRRTQPRGACLCKVCVRPPSPNPSDLSPSMSDDDADESATDVDSSDDGERDNKVGTSVVALQHLYAVFLPPPLAAE